MSVTLKNTGVLVPVQTIIRWDQHKVFAWSVDTVSLFPQAI